MKRVPFVGFQDSPAKAMPDPLKAPFFEKYSAFNEPPMQSLGCSRQNGSILISLLLVDSQSRCSKMPEETRNLLVLL